MNVAERLCAIGNLVRTLRADRRLSVDAAAAEAQLGHVTWRRIEHGLEVRHSSLAALDDHHQVPSGAFFLATRSDQGYSELRGALKLDPEPLPQVAPVLRFDAYDLGTLRRVAALIQAEIERLEPQP